MTRLHLTVTAASHTVTCDAHPSASRRYCDCLCMLLVTGRSFAVMRTLYRLLILSFAQMTLDTEATISPYLRQYTLNLIKDTSSLVYRLTICLMCVTCLFYIIVLGLFLIYF